MVIRTWNDWVNYTSGLIESSGAIDIVPTIPPSYPVIVLSQLTNYTNEDDSNAYVHFTFYTVEDWEKPDQASEYMGMLEDFPLFMQAVTDDILMVCKIEGI